jgi:hypothetical protein
MLIEAATNVRGSSGGRELRDYVLDRIRSTCLSQR